MSATHFDRPRLTAAIARAARFPVALIVGSAGSGKSVALGDYLGSCERQAIRFDVRVTDTTLIRFVRGLASALAPTLPKVPQSLAIANERATQSTRPADILAAWLAEHLHATALTIVVDNYHRCEEHAAIAAFLAAVVDRTRARTHWIVATRSAGRLPFAKWFARGDADVPVNENVLALAPHEAVAFASLIAPGTQATVVKRLHDVTLGSIGRLRYALGALERDPTIIDALVAGAADAFEQSVDLALSLLEPQERKFVAGSIMLPDPGPIFEGAEIACVAAKIPHAFNGRGEGLRYTPFFADVVREAIARTTSAATAEAHAYAGAVLERSARFVEALAHYLSARDSAAVARLIEAHGLGLLETGYGDVVGEAIDALDPAARAGSAAILAIRATIESRLGHFDAAESWYVLALGRTADAKLSNRIAYHYATHLLRFKKPAAIELLEALVERTDRGCDLHWYGRSALGPAYIFARRNDEASASADVVVREVADSANHHLRARAFHQAAFVALCRDEGERAKALAAVSLELAQTHGYFDIAAGALTVSYNIASDLEDDPVQSLRVLDDVADCAAKSGSLTNHFLALVAKLEIVVEGGDEVAIDELDRKLRKIDARCAGSAAVEALVSSQALRAGWNGDYVGAYRLLVSSSEEQWSADRKALRWAEVAVYAAAARLDTEAAAAIRSSLELIEVCEPANRIVRARLFIALAMILSARSEGAQAMLALVESDQHAVSGRMRALRHAIAALWERYRGVRNGALMLDALDALEGQHLGGLGRLMRGFPLADNASLRLSDLSLPERRVLAKLGRRDAIVSEPQVKAVLAKLACVDVRAATRRLPSVRSANDGTLVHSSALPP